MNHILKLSVSHHTAESDSDLNMYCRHLHSIKQSPCRGYIYTNVASRMGASWQEQGR